MLIPVSKKYEKLAKISLVSFTILFLELLLIRLIGTELRIFAYLSNVVLLCIFVGSGLGMFFKKKLSLIYTLFFLCLLIVILISGFFTKITDYLAPLSESFIWFQQSLISSATIIFGVAMTTILLLLLAAVFVPLGQYLGEQFKDSKKLIILYSLNIAFSLMGIISFNLFSFISVSPYIGLMFAFLLIILLLEKKELQKGLAIMFVVLPLLFVYFLATKDTTWSPYQKLSLEQLPDAPYFPDGEMLLVNNIGYMGLLDLSASHDEKLNAFIKNNNITVEGNLTYRNQYGIPYILNKNASEVLIIGAGGGNDIAGALKGGAQYVDAVEIDPKIIDFGKEYHPEGPYLSDKVNIVADDGRAFLKRTDKKYDVVVLGLVDSHTLNSSLNNVQLDNYLYTKESFEDIHKVLKEDGMLFLSFDVRREWIGARIKSNVSEAFGKEPLIFSMQNELPIYGWGGVFFVQTKNPDALDNFLNAEPELKEFLFSKKTDFGEPNKKLSDNWPYLYLDQPRIPGLHVLISAILLVSLLVLTRITSFEGTFHIGSFLLGAGFLLYEFQSISKTALIYGNTWVTNVFTISAILFFILLANLVTLRYKFNLKLLFLFLVGSFVVQLFIPLSLFNTWPSYLKFSLVPLILNLPLLFSGLIFIRLFEKAKDEKSFFASNLFGSAVGGLLGFLSYLLGIQSLLYVSLFLYLLAIPFTTMKLRWQKIAS
ncbi:spermidine synthase [Patescibacteria group bacterium]